MYYCKLAFCYPGEGVILAVKIITACIALYQISLFGILFITNQYDIETTHFINNITMSGYQLEYLIKYSKYADDFIFNDNSFLGINIVSFVINILIAFLFIYNVIRKNITFTKRHKILLVCNTIISSIIIGKDTSMWVFINKLGEYYIAYIAQIMLSIIISFIWLIISICDCYIYCSNDSYYA